MTTGPSVNLPASEYCQRWSAGTHSWKHPTDGGFRASRYRVVELPEAIARPFVERHHYAGSYPAARLAYGLTTLDHELAIDGTHIDGLALVGVAVLSVPMSSAVLTNVFPALEPYVEALELGRFVLTPTPANAESWFLARIWQLAADRGVRGVVSFADPLPRQRQLVDVDELGAVQTRSEVITPGHVGLIYQATNAHACGRSTARTLAYLPRHGLVLSARTLSKVRAQESGADAAERHLVNLGARARRAEEDPRSWLRQALADLEVQRIRHPGNFRYAWAIGTPSQRRHVAIALPRTAYPKPAHDLVPVSGHTAAA